MSPSNISIDNNSLRLRLWLLLWLAVGVVGDADHSPCSASALESQRLINEDVPKACWGFTNGQEFEFFSPGYPGLYPNATVCYKTITAPFGYVIRLEFRERFYVEPSPNCEYDYLEVRDGIRGYADLIGRYCGNTFPTEVTSSDRYLWLRFTSDSTIQYGGFRVHYKYIKSNAYGRPDLKPCSFQVCGVEGKLGTSMIREEHYNYSLTYGVPLKCLWEISVQVNWKIYLNFDKYVLGKPNECKVNFIDIFNDSLESTAVQARFCGSATESKWSTGHKMHLLYYEDLKATKDKRGEFEANFTAFRTTGKNEKCRDTEFDCEDSTCIDLSLRCNQLYNCKYSTDEDLCLVMQTSLFGQQKVQIILIVGLGLLLSILVPSCLNFYRKLRKNGGASDDGSSRGGGGETEGARTAEGSLHEGAHASSTKGLLHEDSGDCYVPEVDLSLFLARTNGGHSVSMVGDSPPLSGQDTPLDCTLPTAFDSADPLIATTPTGPQPPFLSHVPPLLPTVLHRKAPPAYPRTSTPPLPPPPTYYNEGDLSHHPLFMPPPPTMEEVEESDAIFGLPALAPTRAPLDKRPRSFESTKSAPDVIGRI